MHWHSIHRHSKHWHNSGWLKGLSLAALLLLLASLLSFDFNDPSITNLRYPAGGISNLAGLPGALLGGSLVELLGTSSLWVPLLLANWMLIPANRRELGPYLLFGGSAILFSATLHGLLADNILPAITAPGLAGIAGSRWMLRATEFSVAAPLLCAALVFALVQLLRLPLLGSAFRDGRIIALYIFRIALARCVGWWRAFAFRGRAMARFFVRGRPGLGLARLKPAVLRMAGLSHRRGGPRESMHSPGGGPGGGQTPEAPPAATSVEPKSSPLPALPRPAGGMVAQDGFNTWISALGKPAHGAEPADKP